MLTQEQIAARRNFIGGSDAAAVLGLSRWKTPLEVWAEKTGAVPAQSSESLAMEVGSELEDLVCKLFTKRTGKKVARVNETMFHPNYSFLGANIDRRIVGEDAILEAKTCGGWKAAEWDGDAVPQEYVIQAMHYMAVTGKDHCYVAVLIGGNQDFVWKVVERDPVLLNEIVQRQADFWTRFIEPKVMPKIVTANDGDILRRLFPDGQPGEPVALSSEADTVAESLKALQREEKRIKAAVDQEKNRLCQMLGDNGAGATSRYTITWTNQAGSTYQVTRKPTRVLRVTEIKTKPQAPIA